MWITLTGYMACGKSAVAQVLGLSTGLGVVSLDDLAIKKIGCPISQFFSEKGEARFRELELDLLKNLPSGADMVVDAGGGLVENPKSVSIIREHGMVVWLDVPWELVDRRLKIETEIERPLVKSLGWDGLENLFQSRMSLYAKAADFRISAEMGSPQELAHQISMRWRVWREEKMDPA